MGDLAYTVGYERFNGSIDDGRPVEPITVRVTHIAARTGTGRSSTVTATPTPDSEPG